MTQFKRVYDSLLQRVMARVYIPEGFNENGCWIFGGKLDQNGYGRVNVRINGRHRTIRTHKIVWEAHYGPLTPGLTLDHSDDCLGRACCNPDHLDPCTKAENTRRSHRKYKAIRELNLQEA